MTIGKPAPTPVQTAVSRRITPASVCGWWLLVCAMRLSTQDASPFREVRVLDAPADSVLTPDHAWSTPLVHWEALAEWSEAPFWCVLAVAAGLIARECRHLGWSSPFRAIHAAIGLSLLWEPRDLIPGLALLGVVQLAPRNAGDSARWFAWLPSLAVATGSMLVTLEFGFVLVVWGVLWLSRFRSDSRWPGCAFGTVLPGVLAAGVLAGVCLLLPGGLDAALRPVSCLWLRPDPALLSTCAPVLSTAAWRWLQAPLVVWLALQWRSGGTVSRSIWLLASLVGLACGRYLWLGSWTLVLVESRMARPVQLQRYNRQATYLSTAIAVGVLLAWQRLPWAAWLLTGVWPATRLEPQAWRIGGPVMLADLDSAAEWQTRGARSEHRLLLDDRWDIFGTEYGRWAGLYRDLGEGRHESYRLADGSWGGYIRWLRKHQPSLLVVPIADGERIRNLSLSPDWKVLGLDAERTIFGREADSRTLPQAQRAVRAIAALEWPDRPGLVPDPSVIAAESPRAARSVAGGLCTLRFPYAGLRLLPADASTETRVGRAWCYLELAHRTHRYAGEASLLDQLRTLHQVSTLLAEGAWTDHDRTLLARSLRELGARNLAGELQPGDDLAMQTAVSAPSDEPTDAMVSSSDASERRLRTALRSGDLVTAEQFLPRLPAASQRAYRALLETARLPPSVAAQVLSVVITPELPASLRGELAFYLGCLAIEAGDPGAAVSQLLASREASPDSPFEGLRRLYLDQLIPGG